MGEMEEIEISKIVIKDNVRKDYGDLTGLAASIKENGVRNPVELNSKLELIDGHRRVKAAIAAGLTKIPYFINDTEMPKTKMQIISGIFNKKLNPIEQGEAFRKYMDENKITSEQLAKQISKPKDYVDKRLLLNNLPDSVKKELIGQKIQIGHALLLAKMPKTEASAYVKDIIRHERGVEDAKSNLVYNNKQIKSAPFDKSQCKDCKYNGSVQSELFETGKTLTGICLNPGCYGKKVAEFVKAKKEEFKDVLFKGQSEYDTPKGYIEGDSYTAKEKGITEAYKKKCRKDKNYLVTISNTGTIREFFMPPSKKEQAAAKGNKAAEKAKEAQREERLETKVAEFKAKFLRMKSKELLDPESIQAKRLQLIKMIIDNPIEVMQAKKPEAIIKITDTKALNAEIARYSKVALNQLDQKDLILVSRDIGVDLNKHFQITEEYLEMYTKEQLVDLMDELDMDGDETVDQTTKKPEIIKAILKHNLKGKVPKIMQR